MPHVLPYRRRSLAPLVICWGLSLVIVWGVGIAPGEAVAQGGRVYDTMPADKDKVLNRDRGLVNDVLASTSGNLTGDKKEKFDRFITLWLAQMTLPESESQAANCRSGFLKQFYVRTKSPEVLRHLNNLVLPILKQIAEGNYQPAARFNAVLLLGDLDEKLGEGVDASTRPYPHAETLGTLYEYYRKPEFPDYLRVASLIGMERWLRHRKPNEATHTAAIIHEMLALLTQDAPPKNRDEKGHLWMRRRAADVLAALGEPGVKNEVVEGMLQVVRNTKLPFGIRCPVAGSLGSLRLKADAKLDIRGIAQLLACLAHDACVTEQVLATNRQELPSRSHLVECLVNVRGGLKICENAPEGPDRQFVLETIKPIDDVLAILSKKMTDEQLEEDLPELCKKIEPATPCPASKTEEEKKDEEQHPFGDVP